MLQRKAVPVAIVYTTRIQGDGDASDVRITLRMRNRKDAGLGVPLPAGPVALFQPHGGTSLLLGEGSIGDKAIGEEVEASIADATQVTVETANPASGKAWERYLLTVRNANPYPVTFEAQFDAEDFPRMSLPSGTLTRKDGKYLWTVELPANGTRTFGYRFADAD